MTDSKALHEEAEEDFVVKLDDLQKMLQNASGNLEPLRTQVQKHLQPVDLQQMENAQMWIGKCMTNVVTAKQNLDSVTEILNTRKASLELKEIAFRSWPKKSYIERMTWIATALFPAGGIPFVFTDGLTSASLATAIVIWSIGSVILVLSLLALKRDDDDKWEFYENEFGVERNMLETLRKYYPGVVGQIAAEATLTTDNGESRQGT